MRAVAWLLVLGACSPIAAQAQRIAVYQSERNHDEYAGVHQSPLTAWLDERGLAYDLIGDAEASSAEALSAYDLVMTTSTYIVPDEACAGLTGYVRDGGSLLWIDSPARVANPGLRSALGLGPNGTYVQSRRVVLEDAAPGHPICLGDAGPTRATVVGNLALTVSAEARAVVTMRAEDDGAPYPAVVTRQFGEGRTIVCNWIVWLSREAVARELLERCVLFALGEASLKAESFASYITPLLPQARQPDPVELVVCALARGEHTGEAARVELQVGGRALDDLEVVLTEVGEPDLAAGVARVILPTDGRPDGAIVVEGRASLGDRTVDLAQATVSLRGEMMARLEREEEERHARLAPRFAGTLGDYDLEPRTPDGRVDIPRLMEQIRTANMTMYDFLIWHAPTDWEDFHAFLPIAREAGIDVWVTLCPPSEQGDGYPYSEPFRLDFVRWAQEIGKLAREYDNLIAMIIDDFAGNFRSETISEVVAALREQAPDVAFLPTVYWPTIGDEDFMADFGPLMDGIVFAYTEYVTGDGLSQQLDAAREWMGPHKLLLVNAYATGSGGGPAPDRTEAYMRKVLTVSREKADGIRIYCLPKDALMDDPLYAVTAELYGRWRDTESAK